MNKLNFDTMTRDELAHFMVANRDSAEGMEAQRVFIRRMAEKAKSQGIELEGTELRLKSVNNKKDC